MYHDYTIQQTFRKVKKGEERVNQYKTKRGSRLLLSLFVKLTIQQIKYIVNI